MSNRDDSLGLKEIVIGLENDGQYEAYKLQEVEDKRIINDEINNRLVALFSPPPFMVRAFDPVVDGQALQFRYNPQSNNFPDTQTGSEWNIEGLAINGTMEGRQLARIPLDEGFGLSG